MPKWKAWPVIGVMASLSGLLLWWGLAIVVRYERFDDDRVDVTLERRFLGLLSITSETVRDVVEADLYVVRGRSGGRQRGSTVALELTPREGSPSRWTRFGPSFGTQPQVIVDQIRQFIKDPTKPPLTAWWMPWLVNIAALPFVLIVGWSAVWRRRCLCC
jgi:hypothetical protein